LLKSHKNEIKILADPGLAQSGFEQPGPGGLPVKAAQGGQRICSKIQNGGAE